jgi:SAM-dependent methyltransferase
LSRLTLSGYLQRKDLDDDRRIERARTFDNVAQLYDRARRAYPEEFFDDLFVLAEIAPDECAVLEVGCGTGQASMALARRGCRILCVEMGANLARVARSNLAPFERVAVVNARFEDFEPGTPFDMVLAANSWHWIDPRSRYEKAAAALKPGGVLAFTTGCHAFPPGFDPFFTEIQACYDAIGEGRVEGWKPPPPEQIPDSRKEIEQSGLFEDVRVARRVRAEEFTADEYVAMMATASDHVLMEPDKRMRLFAEMRRLIDARPDGRIRRHWLTILDVARRKA